MKHHTKKRAALEREYQKVKSEIMQNRPHCCAGCGTWSGWITFSHRIPRSRNIQLLPDPNNIDLMCQLCHDKVETGRYSELLNGEEIREYIGRVDPEFFCLKVLVK